MADAPAHSLAAVRDLIRFARADDVHLACIAGYPQGSAGTAAYYAGLRRASPARTLLEAALGWLSPQYERVLVATGKSISGSQAHLPVLELGGAKVGVEATIWWFRSPPPPGPDTATSDNFAAAAMARAGRAENNRVAWASRNSSWPERVSALLIELEKLAGVAFTGQSYVVTNEPSGATLVLVDEEYFRVSLADRAAAGEAAAQYRLAHRFTDSLRQAGSAGVDVAWLCGTVSDARAWVAGEGLDRVVDLSDKDETGEVVRRRFGIVPLSFPDGVIVPILPVPEDPLTAGRGWFHGQQHPADSRPLPYRGLTTGLPYLQEDLMHEIETMVGLQAVKDELRRTQDFLKWRVQRKAENPDLRMEPLVLHTRLEGNPGTGKTTVARILGRIYRDVGLLPTDRFVECQGADLVAGFVGQTRIQTQRMVEQALGGVLFIDEAYAMATKGNRQFGEEAITVLLKAMLDHAGELAVIVAGYSKDIEELLKVNVGLDSRLPYKFEFPDYTDDELVEIGRRMAASERLELGEAATEGLRRALGRRRNACGSDPRAWGNAREVKNLLQHAKTSLASRASRLRHDPSAFLAQDFSAG